MFCIVTMFVIVDWEKCIENKLYMCLYSVFIQHFICVCTLYLYNILQNHLHGPFNSIGCQVKFKQHLCLASVLLLHILGEKKSE